MPKYDVKCENGHREEVRLNYEQYDRVQRGEVGLFCTSGACVCLGLMSFVLTPIPHVFAVNDGDFQFSKRKFGMGNLKEI